MKKIFILAVILLSLVLGISCSKDSTGPGVGFRITLKILQDGFVHNTYQLTENDDGRIIPVYWLYSQIGNIKIEMYSLYDCMRDDSSVDCCLVIARKYENYSLVNAIGNSDTLCIDYQQDFAEYPTNINCGVIYDNLLGAIPNMSLSVYLDSVLIDTITTGDEGQFVTELEPADYVLDQEIFAYPFNLQAGYAEYVIDAHVAVDKPNIYLYPETEIFLDVDIALQGNGIVKKSIPEFPEQWKNLHIKPDGKINGEFDYLFYETVQRADFQREKGWIVPQDSLAQFFTDNLRQSGFNTREIEDFISYWIPRMNNAQSYVIYPQYKEQLEQLITLTFSKQPDTIIRVIYLVDRVGSDDIVLISPEIPNFTRGKFTVREWGVIPEFLDDQTAVMACEKRK